MEMTFDALRFFDRLKAANVPEEQARVQAETLRSAFAAYDASKMKDLVTKADLQIELEKLRAEIEKSRYELRAEMKAQEIRLLKWLIGTVGAMGATLIAIMAKGFGWVGF